MNISDRYWEALKEMAAFYARHRDFHAAAEIARRVQAGTAGKKLRPYAAVAKSSASPPVRL